MSEQSARAQAFLLSEGGPLSLRKLAGLLDIDEKNLSPILDETATFLEGSGLSLIRTETSVGLATAPRVSDAVKKAFENSLSRDIGNAGLEVLAIVLYRGPSTRARIDYIRGVNTSSTIRLLLSRGLLERAVNPEDAREFLYRPTPDLLAHLGIREGNELPEYATIRSELDSFEQKQANTADHDGITELPESGL